jgi:hypothetical protein
MFEELLDEWRNYICLIQESIYAYLDCINGKDSGNFFTCLVTNNGHFCTYELILLGLGFSFWAVAYIDVLRNIHRFKIVEIPIIVAAMDLSFELIWGFLNINNSLGLLFNLGNIVWFVKDLHINYHALKYGPKLVTNKWVIKNYRIIYAFIFINSFFITYFMSNGLYQIDDGMGLVAAYFINLVISALYIYQLLTYPEYRNKGFSYRVAWTKFLGTGVISIVCFTSYSVAFLHWMCISVFIMDVAYIYLFKYYQPAPTPRQLATIQ